MKTGNPTENMVSLVAFLRGINVGGNKKIPMKSLVELFEALGYKNVSTYLQSGNVFFESSDLISSCENNIEEAILKKFGFDVRVIVKSKPEIFDIIENNPFNEDPYGPETTLFVSMLFSDLSSENQTLLMALSSPLERIVCTSEEVYTLLLRSHFPKSHMSKNVLLSKFETDSTARNWNTMSHVLNRM